MNDDGQEARKCVMCDRPVVIFYWKDPEEKDVAIPVKKYCRRHRLELIRWLNPVMDIIDFFMGSVERAGRRSFNKGSHR
jgi:hypothetical protein